MMGGMAGGTMVKRSTCGCTAGDSFGCSCSMTTEPIYLYPPAVVPVPPDTVTQRVCYTPIPPPKRHKKVK